MDECIYSFQRDSSPLRPRGGIYIPPPALTPPYNKEQLQMEDMFTQTALFSIHQNQLNYFTPPPHDPNFMPQSPLAAIEDDSYFQLMDGKNMPFSRYGGVEENVATMKELPEMLEYCSQCEMDSYDCNLVQCGYANDDLQVFGNNNIGECSSRVMNQPAPDEYTMKIGRLSAEERKEKINRYMKKKTERNFTKKIKYACRKTLADSRHRVRGRFAKNEEFGEASVHNYDGEEEEEEVMVREEELMFNSSGILASDCGVDSFQYNYTLQ